jgi:peptide/nickel transport system substrate-binding protein
MKFLRRAQPRQLRLSLLDRYFRYLYHLRSFDRTLFAALLAVFFVSGGLWLWQQGAAQQTVVPTNGGVLHEGIVGAPRFVNPVLAITRADQDMAQLLFRGLYTVDESGILVPDLAESVTISDDGRVYNLKLKTDQFWHDNTPITAEDVRYTIALVQNPELKSPIRGNWNDVGIELIDTHELNLVLDEPYTPFIENLTLGIVPRHLFERLSTDEIPFSQYNTQPVGSGPFRIAAVQRSESGLIERYELEPFAQHGSTPAIARLVVHFFADEPAVRRALEAGEITHTAALDHQSVAVLAADHDYTVYTAALPRVFGMYPNQNRNAVLRDQAVRRALSYAIDRGALVNDILSGYGTPAYSPIPPGFGPATTGTSSLDRATNALLAGGWEQTSVGGWEKEIDDVVVPLAVTITTANVDPFEASAEAVAEAWTALGVDVSIALYEQSDLVQAVIRPRDYQLLLFGTEIGRQLDLYPFWHSSQREDPGLNVAQYTNITVDDVLEKYRTDSSANPSTLLETFLTEFQADEPAIFLFAPQFTYVTRSDIPIPIPDLLNRPSERFAALETWHVESESLWPFMITRLPQPNE